MKAARGVGEHRDLCLPRGKAAAGRAHEAPQPTDAQHRGPGWPSADERDSSLREVGRLLLDGCCCCEMAGGGLTLLPSYFTMDLRTCERSFFLF